MRSEISRYTRCSMSIREYFRRTRGCDARVERIWDGASGILRHVIGRGLLRPLGA